VTALEHLLEQGEQGLDFDLVLDRASQFTPIPEAEQVVVTRVALWASCGSCNHLEWPVGKLLRPLSILQPWRRITTLDLSVPGGVVSLLKDKPLNLSIFKLLQ
jgi:hypothetical protein